MEEYLQINHTDDITNLMNEKDENAHLSIFVSLQHLQQTKFDLFLGILYTTHDECIKWDKALLELQKKIVHNGDAFLDDNYTIKINCHVRFINLPPPDLRYKPRFPGNDQIGQFVQLKANVVRITQPKLFEKCREYVCSKCKELVLAEAKYERMYVFEPPRSCSNENCRGTMYQAHSKPMPEYCLDFQEIRIQELLNERNIPASLTVTLENDLVDLCQPGECVTLCGTIERRWKQIVFGKKPEISIAMRAISLTRDKKRMMLSEKFQPEHLVCLKAEWEDSVARFGELEVRDTIVESICPEVRGMYPVKLAIALVVCSGGIENTQTTSSGTSVRGQSHLLMVGDPGLAKSRLLMSAAAFAPRAVHTTGMGSSAAGLTAAAIQENGEWQLEAGALVLGDGGICCIDEFNLMRETDRASIHEAMEQQTVSLAKAGMVCKLSTRTAVLAATNPKNLYTMSEPLGTSSINIGIASPLMSRFDLVYILRDEHCEEWDDLIATHLLQQAKGIDAFRLTNRTLWTIDQLQSHFAAIRTVHPTLSNEANRLLGEYYRICRNDSRRDNARTTVRLLDSLTRLAQAHARLLFRDVVTAYDAVIVIRLMESTHGFGRILQPFNVIKEKFPLGPSRDDVEEVYSTLNLGEFDDVSAKIPTQVPVSSQSSTASNSTTSSGNVARTDAKSQKVPNTTNLTHQKISIADEDFSDNELDQALTLDNFNTVFHSMNTGTRGISQVFTNELSQPTAGNDVRIDDSIEIEDEILSQALDEAQPTAGNDASIDDSIEFEDEILSQALDEAQDILLSQCAEPPKPESATSDSNTIPKNCVVTNTKTTNIVTAANNTSKFQFQISSRNSKFALNSAKNTLNKENLPLAKTKLLSTLKKSDTHINSNDATEVHHVACVSRNGIGTKRNRLLDSSGSSDEEGAFVKRKPLIASPTSTGLKSKLSPKTTNKLNAFLNPKLPQQNVEQLINIDVFQADTTVEPTRKDKEEDSAYCTQYIEEILENQPQSVIPVRIDQDDDDDLSCLDSLDLME